jgi:uroporphyrinogen decarboxylase
MQATQAVLPERKGADIAGIAGETTSLRYNPVEYPNHRRFLSALHCEPVDRPPIWLMRQAGRCLPEYRELRKQFSFRELIATPKLAAEVTLQPVRRFDFDAAILFSDILVIPEAMGQSFHFADTGGVKMSFTVREKRDIDRLDISAIAERLAYVGETIKLIRSGLKGRTALLGFAGSPWTLANFMLEGGSSRKPVRALELFRSDPELYKELAWKLTRAVIEFLQMQIDAGVDAIQIFDSMGGLLSNDDFGPASGRWLRMISTALCSQVPVIVFSKGCRDWDTLRNIGADAIGIDHEIDIAEAAREFQDSIALQGNFDPALLSTATPETVRAEALALLEKMSGRDGHIFNLGHGVPPDAKMANLEALVSTVQDFHSNR